MRGETLCESSGVRAEHASGELAIAVLSFVPLEQLASRGATIDSIRNSHYVNNSIDWCRPKASGMICVQDEQLHIRCERKPLTMTIPQSLDVGLTGL